MKIILAPFQVLALVGFVLSIYVHVLSLLGARAFERAEALHVGVFLVVIPAFLVNLGIFFKFGFRQRELWRNLLSSCPPWMTKAAGGLLAYAILNFFLFIVWGRGEQPPFTGEGMSPAALRAFSGHWMIFYWASFAMLYSRAHRERCDSNAKQIKA